MERAILAATGFDVGPHVIIMAEGELLPDAVVEGTVFAADLSLQPPEGFGLWVFEGEVDYPGDEERPPSFVGDWRRPNEEELHALGCGENPWEVPL